MPRYKTRPGVELASICGEYFLVSARDVLEFCPYIVQINGSSAFLWKRLRSGADEDELVSAVEEEFEVRDRDAAKAAIAAFIDQMIGMNYLIEEQRGTI